MMPVIGGFSAWNVAWLVGAIAGSIGNLFVLRARGLPAGRVLVALTVAGVVAYLGARVEWMVENGVPARDLLVASGFRAPGGFLALLVVLPPLLHQLRLPVLAVADGLAPGAAISIAIGRIGCLLHGCCFGTPTDLPWGIRFPNDSAAFESHRRLGFLTFSASASLPVHPLELYFSLDAIAIAGFLLWLLPRRAYAGQVCLAFLVLHGWSRVALDQLRGQDFSSLPSRAVEVELGIALVGSATLAAIALRRLAHRRQQPGRWASSARSPARRARGVPPLTEPPY